MYPPLVSVVLPVYNGAHYLAEAIESILLQTFQDFELIIINDGSTDKSLDIIKQYAMKNPMIFVIDRENRGLVASLNEGIAKAQGKYIARMDQDDISLPTRFEKQIDLLEKDADLVLCGTWATIIDSDGTCLKNSSIRIKHEDIMKDMERCINPFFHPSVMFRKSNNLFYNETAFYCEDYEMWVKCSAIGRLANIPEYLLKYRIEFQSMTNSKRYLAFWNVSHVFFKFKYLKRNNLELTSENLTIQCKTKMNIFQKQTSFLYSKGMFLSYQNRRIQAFFYKAMSIVLSPNILIIYIRRLATIYYRK